MVAAPVTGQAVVVFFTTITARAQVTRLSSTLQAHMSPAFPWLGVALVSGRSF